MQGACNFIEIWIPLQVFFKDFVSVSIKHIFQNISEWFLTPLHLLKLIHLFPMHPFSSPLKISENLTVFWCFQGVEKGCIRNKWVNRIYVNSIKVVIMRGNFMKWNFKIRLEHKLLSFVVGIKLFKERSKLKLTEKRKKPTRLSLVGPNKYQQNVPFHKFHATHISWLGKHGNPGI